MSNKVLGWTILISMTVCLFVVVWSAIGIVGAITVCAGGFIGAGLIIFAIDLIAKGDNPR